MVNVEKNRFTQYLFLVSRCFQPSYMISGHPTRQEQWWWGVCWCARCSPSWSEPFWWAELESQDFEWCSLGLRDLFFNMHFFVMSCLDVSMYNKGFVFCNFRSKNRYGNTWQRQRALRLRMPTRCGWNLMPGLLSRLDAKDPKFDWPNRKRFGFDVCSNQLWYQLGVNKLALGEMRWCQTNMATINLWQKMRCEQHGSFIGAFFWMAFFCNSVMLGSFQGTCFHRTFWLRYRAF